MPARARRTIGRLAVLALSAGCLAAGTGCGNPEEAGAAPGAEVSEQRSRKVSEQRAREVAAAWDGSTAATGWRAGYHPMGEVIELPRGGLRSKADQQAYEDRRFVLEGALPATGPEDGRVTWAGGGSLARPLVAADESYRALTVGGRIEAGPHLTVTGAKLSEMTVATNRGPATVPAWLFTLDGYAAPLKRAAVVPSELPAPPIGRARGVPGHPLDRLVRITADGRSVTVSALHGACDDGPLVDVLETRGSVVLSASVKSRKSSGNCTDQGILKQVTVELDRPVGERVLIDAHTGRPVPYKPPHGLSPSWS